MSATRDTSQSTTFIYSNFYSLYRKSKSDELAKGLVLKSHAPEVHIASGESETFQSWSKGGSKNAMAEHLRTLRDAKKRLSFLMAELDELLKRE